MTIFLDVAGAAVASLDEGREFEPDIGRSSVMEVFILFFCGKGLQHFVRMDFLLLTFLEKRIKRRHE